MTELETLLPILNVLALTDIIEPTTPMAVALQEANDLHVAIQTDDTWERLMKVGVAPSTLAGLPVAVVATRQAQSQWVVARDRGKPQAQRDREQAGMLLRSDQVAACRWNLRHLPPALAVVDQIVQGEGVPDLVQDLLDLAALVDQYEDAFDGDETFDAPAQAEAARGAAAEITAGLSESRTLGDHETAKLLRDRAYSHLAKLVADVREAGRYAFRKEPRRAVAFGSAYMRKAKTRSRRRSGTRANGEAEVITTDA
jgi:hypothetical protein